MPEPDPYRVPTAAVLLHIGPFKTGTTAIQGALAQARPDLAAQGVSYPGTRRQHSRPAMAALGTVLGWVGRGGEPVPHSEWEALCATVAAEPATTVLSSEFFSNARADQARAVVADLGGERVHVVVTLRPLGRLLPSSWQQFVKSGRSGSYEEWLNLVFADRPTSGPARSFWGRQDHGALVERWSAAAPGRTTVVVVDDSDRDMLYRSFERLLGLRTGTLTSGPQDRTNRSLSAPEVELLRAVNSALDEAGLQWGDYRAMVRDGAVRRLLTAREPAPDEARIVTPAWALARAADASARAVRQIRAADARVLGDLDALSVPVPPEPPRDATMLPVNAAAELLLGAISGATRRGAWFSGPVKGLPERFGGTRPGVAVRARYQVARWGGAARRRLARLSRSG